jgi:hypothetical protein
VNANLIATLKMAAAKLVAETAAKVTRKRMFKTCFNALGLSCPQLVCHRFEFLQWGESGYSIKPPECCQCAKSCRLRRITGQRGYSLI